MNKLFENCMESHVQASDARAGVPEELEVGPVPQWERGYRTYGYWLGQRRVGRVSLPPPPSLRKHIPLVYRWELDYPWSGAGETRSLRAAKKAVERAYSLAPTALASLPQDTYHVHVAQER